jgi:hypothetical protein
LEDVFGDPKDLAGVEDMTNNAGENLTGVEYMKVKGEEATKNGIRNEAEEGKQQRCLVIRGHS